MSLFDGKSTIPERKYIPGDSPPKSPHIRPVRSVESTVDGEGRSVEEMRRIIRKILIENLPQVQEVRKIRGHIVIIIIIDHYYHHHH